MVRLAPRSGGLAASLLVATLALAAAPVRAGGPLLICDAATGRAFAFAPGQVPMFSDLGPLGFLTNAQATALAVQAAAEWASVPTSSFDAAVVGTIGVDIDATNVTTVIGVKQGHGGVDIIFDSDGGIINGLLGAPPGVAGIAGPEFIDPATCALTEAWEMINGTLIDPGDVVGASYAGVLTHELGHAIGLAHTQTNGGVYYFGDDPVPQGCPAPFATTVAAADVETMYPFIDIRPGEAGVEMATIDVRDDLAALSNLYPGPGWPASFPALSGVVYDTDAVTPVLGVNVIARNLADPFAGAVSMLSGASTRGVLGPDGSFRLAGLDPGADYVVYLDRIIAGGFSTPLSELWEEEYWNGSGEGNDSTLDLACDLVTVQPTSALDPILNRPSDPTEPNDTFAQAEPIACSSVSNRVVFPVGDVDFFRFDLPIAATVRIDVDAANLGSTLDATLGLFDSAQTLLSFSDDDPAPAEPATLDPFIGEPLSPGSYFVGLSSFADTSFDGAGALTQGTYTLHLDCFPTPGPPRPGDLLGATGNFLTLVDVDRTSGAATYRADEGTFGPVVGLTVRPDGLLYGSTGLGDLITIDPADGSETLVGSHGGGALNGLELVGDVLYGTLYGGGTETTLVQVDTVTATLTTVGGTGVTLVTGLAWDAVRGRLLGVTGGGPSDLVVLDLTAGVASVIGATGFERLGSLVFGPDGVLYAGIGTGASTNAGSLVTLDPSTGRGSLVGASGWGGLTGLAALPTGTATVAIPALDPRALLLLAVGLALAGAHVLRR